MLKTRYRERRLLEVCLETGQRMVVDNTHARRVDRADAIRMARGAKFRVIGYYFKTTVAAAMARNEQRTGTAKIPNVGLFTTYKRLEPPAMEEGFDELYCVALTEDHRFTVEAADGQNMVK